MKEYAGKVLMIVENSFPYDIRVKNEATTLTDAGYKVSVIALRKKGDKKRETFKGINVYRIPKITLFKKTNQSSVFIQRIIIKFQSIMGYLFEYMYFTSASFFLSLYILFKEGFDVVHIHNPPDITFVIGMFYRMLGKKFVFDHHDLSPELYLSRYNISGGLVYNVLTIIERFCLKFSNLVIATNESYKEIEINRGKLNPGKIFIVRNGPDLNRIRLVPPDENLKKLKKTILLYLGVMNPQDGVDYLLRTIHYLAYKLDRNDFYCVIIGPGDSLDDLKKLSHELKIEENVWFTGYIPDSDLIRYLSTADICIDTAPPGPLNNVSTWIKIMEYMAVGKPIVSFDLKENRVSAQEAALFVPTGKESDFAKALCTLMDNPSLRNKMGELGRNRVKNALKWDIVSQNLLLAYKSLSI